jgi:hypothetical protein
MIRKIPLIVQVHTAREQTKEYTQSGNGQTDIHSIMIKNQPWLMRVGVHAQPLSLYWRVH